MSFRRLLLTFINKHQYYDNVLIYLLCNLIALKVFESLLLLLLLSHADPGVSDQDIAAVRSLHWVRGQNKLGAMLKQNQCYDLI